MRIFIIIATVLIFASLCVEAKWKKDKGNPASNCRKFQKQCEKGKSAACRKVQRFCGENRQVNQQVNQAPAGISDCPTSCQGAERVKVCGTNGQTYYSECFLRKERCRTQGNFEVAYIGKCSRHAQPAGQTAGNGGGDDSSEEDVSQEEEGGQVMQVEEEEPEEPEGPGGSVMQGQAVPNDPEQEPQDPEVEQEGESQDPEGEAENPEGESENPEGESENPEGESENPEGESENPEGESENPEGESENPEGESENPEGESQVDAQAGDGNSENDPGRTNIQEFPQFP